MQVQRINAVARYLSTAWDWYGRPIGKLYSLREKHFPNPFQTFWKEHYKPTYNTLFEDADLACKAGEDPWLRDPWYLADKATAQVQLLWESAKWTGPYRGPWLRYHIAEWAFVVVGTFWATWPFVAAAIWIYQHVHITFT